MKSPAYYLDRLARHARAGTLGLRFRQQITRARHARLDRWWDRQARSREFFDVEVEPGVKLRLHFDSAIARDIYCHDHEAGERAFVRRLLRPGDVFVDVGANLGLYSIIASRCVGSEGAVFAFEPDPRTHDRLLHNLQANECRNVRPFRFALSNEDETRAMQISTAGFDAYNSFGTPVRGEGTFEETPVSCVSFDSFAKKEPLLQKARMMKVDVEGWETMVLHGAQECLSKPDAPVLLVEFNDYAAQSTGHSCADLYRWLGERGYSIFMYDSRRNDLRSHPLLDHYVYDNVIAAKDLGFVKTRIEAQDVPK